jgi:hypothetical protein
MVASILARVAPAWSEVIGPLLPRGTFEIGLQDRDIDRTEVAAGRVEFDLERHDLALVIRWAATEFATVSAEGMTGTDEFVSGSDDLQEFYLLGSGAQATFWRNDRVIVTGALQFTRAFRRWTDERRDQVIDSFSFQVTAQADVVIARQTATFFAGPVYSDEELTVLESLSVPYRTEMSSQTIWGGVLGAVVLLGGHVTLHGQVFWVENPQPRFGIGYRF